MQKDVLIIGQGLAGTTLAFELLERGRTVNIIDDTHASASSLVGVATINPVTGRRYAKSWNIDALLPLVSDVYGRISVTLGKRYLSPALIYQILADARTEENWLLRAADPDFQSYLNTEIRDVDLPGLQPFRYAQIRNAFHLQVSELMHDAARWFTVQGVLNQEAFMFADLEITSDSVKYSGQSYQHIVFCEGHRVVRNPLFSDLEVYPMKGEYLICHIPGLGLHQHLKSAISVIPFQETGHYWCGATYDRYNQDATPTTSARNYILKHLDKIVRLPPTIQHHGVGIRATTRDRRPYVGTHPDHDHVHLIAGLGTKGASLAPYCASILASSICDGETIPRDIDILRHTL